MFVDGPVHTVVTVTGTSTPGLNSTVQVRVISDPNKMGLDELEVRLTLCWRTLIKLVIVNNNIVMSYNVYATIHILCSYALR